AGSARAGSGAGDGGGSGAGGAGRRGDRPGRRRARRGGEAGAPARRPPARGAATAAARISRSAGVSGVGGAPAGGGGVSPRGTAPGLGDPLRSWWVSVNPAAWPRGRSTRGFDPGAPPRGGPP